MIVIDEPLRLPLAKFTAALTAVKQGDPHERGRSSGRYQIAADRLEDRSGVRSSRRDGRRWRQAQRQLLSRRC
jgi:hypothetical protein